MPSPPTKPVVLSCAVLICFVLLSTLLSGLQPAGANSDLSKSVTQFDSSSTTDPSVTATTIGASPTKSVGEAQRQADQDTRRVWLVVYGLLLVALLLLILTVLYWRHTNPKRAFVPAGQDEQPVGRRFRR